MFHLDDHDLVRHGVRAMVDAEHDLTVVGEASCAPDALAAIGCLGPDVAVIDVKLADGDGVEVCREVRSLSPGTRCLILTGYSGEADMVRAVQAGVAGYLIKDSAGSGLVRAIREVARGGSVLDPRATSTLFDRVRRQPDSLLAHLRELGKQEQRVFELLGEGLSNRCIAERLGLAVKTVKNHVSRLLTKLGMERRAQLAAHAARVVVARPFPRPPAP